MTETAQIAPILNELMKRSSWIRRAEVVEPDEVRRDAEAGLRVGEAEVDAAHERRHAEHDDREHRRDEEEQRLAAASAPRRRGAAARLRPSGRRGSGTVVTRERSARGADDEARLDADDPRPAPGMLDAREQQLGGDARALGRAEVDGRQRRPGDGREVRVVHADERDVAGHVEAGRAQRAQRAEREQVVGAEDRVRPHARRSGARPPRGPRRS